jgi:hypothetical protein
MVCKDYGVLTDEVLSVSYDCGTVIDDVPMMCSDYDVVDEVMSVRYD